MCNVWIPTSIWTCVQIISVAGEILLPAYVKLCLLPSYNYLIGYITYVNTLPI